MLQGNAKVQQFSCPCGVTLITQTHNDEMIESVYVCVCKTEFRDHFCCWCVCVAGFGNPSYYHWLHDNRSQAPMSHRQEWRGNGRLMIRWSQKFIAVKMETNKRQILLLLSTLSFFKASKWLHKVFAPNAFCIVSTATDIEHWNIRQWNSWNHCGFPVESVCDSYF